MSTFTELPESARQPQDTQRAALITETSRLAFEIESAERHGAPLADVARLRVAYHRYMAELLALTPGWCPEKVEAIARTARGHREQEGRWQTVVDGLGGEG